MRKKTSRVLLSGMTKGEFMARYIDLICRDCDEQVEVYCDGDHAMMCPECRSIDNFKEVNDDDSFMDD